jgi:hypothetical protein
MSRYLAGIQKIALVIAILAIPDLGFACPDCKRTLAENNLDVAFAVSILFMMSVPFLILAGWGTAIYRMRTHWARLNCETNSICANSPSSSY